MTATLSRHRIGVDLYERMIALGLFGPASRVELIRGEIVDKMAIGEEHAACVDILNHIMNRVLAGTALVRIQNPIRFPDSEPEPDLSLARLRPDYYRTGKPGARDLLLVVEVADTSLEVDREVKRALYAENGIPEYWIVNLVDRTLEVYRQPQADGTYSDIRTLQSGDTLDLSTVPGVQIAVSEIL